MKYELVSIKEIDELIKSREHTFKQLSKTGLILIKDIEKLNALYEYRRNRLEAEDGTTKQN